MTSPLRVREASLPYEDCGILTGEGVGLVCASDETDKKCCVYYELPFLQGTANCQHFCRRYQTYPGAGNTDRILARPGADHCQDSTSCGALLYTIGRSGKR